MEAIADLLFEARILKALPRSGYQFLGAGAESVAEHSFLITFIAYVMTELRPDADARKLTTMCLIHDLPEARTGDLNYVNKRYVVADEEKAVADMIEKIPFGGAMAALIREYNEGKSLEAQLAHDADQLAFIIDLKALSDMGYPSPEKWMEAVTKRLQTDIGKKMAQSILKREQDAWWLKNVVDSSARKE